MNFYKVIVPDRLEGGNCLGIDTELFMEYDHYNDVKRICATCPVALQCFATAVARDECGTWGGVWFGHNAKAEAKGQQKLVGAPTARMIEAYAHMMMRALRIPTEEYVKKYGAPRSIRAFRKALLSLQRAHAA